MIELVYIQSSIIWALPIIWSAAGFAENEKLWLNQTIQSNEMGEKMILAHSSYPPRIIGLSTLRNRSKVSFPTPQALLWKGVSESPAVEALLEIRVCPYYVRVGKVWNNFLIYNRLYNANWKRIHDTNIQERVHNLKIYVRIN